MQELPRFFGVIVLRAEEFPRRSQPIDPRLVFSPELGFQLATQALSERGTQSFRRDGDLQRATAYHRRIIEMAAVRIVHGIAQNPPRLSLAKNFVIHFDS